MQHRTLENGLPLLHIPGSGGSMTIMLLVRAGSRLESQNNSGVAHFLEHMFFKGAKDFPTPKSVSLAVDGLGGMSNAFTGKEYAGYYVKIAKTHAKEAFHVLSDMLLHSTFKEEELEKERGVIIDPSTQVLWDFDRLMYGDQPLGWDEGGTEESVKGLKRQDLVDYLEAHYSPTNSVLAVAGGSTEEVESLATEFFGSYTGTKEGAKAVFDESLLATERLHVRHKDTKQCHVVLGVPGLSYMDERFAAMKVLGTALGGNSSSHLFQRLREELGLCYYVGAGARSYAETGHLLYRAGVQMETLEQAMQEITGIHQALPSILSQDDIEHAKTYLSGTHVLRMEDTEDQAYMAAKSYLLEGKLRTSKDYLQEIDSVDFAQVQALAEELSKKPLMASGIGPRERLSVLDPMFS